ncbi:hypothetical protein CARUB_v10012680mg [Capsella rubella]|uniref:Uncharacterized protein n=1 Tax=Capsella rubella TaxID=81985 RepID=R0IQG3_9BRAS|nr:hypothetical protein CARUB_v10012680mg [Capsella rubella]
MTRVLILNKDHDSRSWSSAETICSSGEGVFSLFSSSMQLLNLPLTHFTESCKKVLMATINESPRLRAISTI